MRFFLLPSLFNIVVFSYQLFIFVACRSTLSRTFCSVTVVKAPNKASHGHEFEAQAFEQLENDLQEAQR